MTFVEFERHEGIECPYFEQMGNMAGGFDFPVITSICPQNFLSVFSSALICPKKMGTRFPILSNYELDEY